MSLKEKRQQVRIASAHLIAQRTRLRARTEWLGNKLEQWRPALLVGGGLIAGMLIGRGSFQKATRSVLSAASLGWALMRSSAGTLLLAKTLGPHSKSDPQEAEPRS